MTKYMNSKQASERIGWLGEQLATQRNNMAKILLRLRDIGVRAGVSLGLHRKFMQLMEQIACERDRELDLINEIEQVEKRHREMKQANKLRRAGDRPADKAVEFTENRQEKEPKR